MADTLITGSSGLIGTAVASAVRQGGGRVVCLVRRPERADDEVEWDPERGTVDRARLEGLDAVVHLAGENIAAGRWNAAKKARIAGSRVEGTRRLCEALAACARPPRVFVGASAIGYYGDRGDQVMTEECAPGTDFLARVCVDWEDASRDLEAVARVVRPRIGVVLSRHGGALHRMLPPFRLGLGGRIGSGRQWLSWIALDDLVALLLHVIADDGIVGAYNATAPRPVTNAEFAQTLARALRRPAVLPLPALAVRCLFGEMGDALLLSSTRVVPQRLTAAGFAFRHPELDGALRAMLGAGGRGA